MGNGYLHTIESEEVANTEYGDNMSMVGNNQAFNSSALVT